ncbi:MAG: LamG domain-containing protein, partial [Planctomycetota bacterium]
MRTQIVLLCIVAACLTVNSPVLATDRLAPIIAADANVTNLVSWWKFNEGNGATAYDSVGGNHGTIHGATWTTDYTGIALDFDGDDYVEVSDDPSLRFTQYDSFSICSWAKPVEGFIVCKMRASRQWGYFGYYIGHTTSNRYFFTAERSMRGSVSVNTGETPQGDWSHVTAVYDNKDMKIYLNGEIEGTGTFTYDTGSTTPDKDLAIGARSVDSLIDHRFNGAIDDVRIYDRALSVEEVRQVYGSMDPNCPTIIWISATEFSFLAVEGGPNPESQVLRIGRMGMGTLNWEVTADCNWINAEPNSGSSMGEANEVTLSVDISGLAFGIYDCNVTISD